MASAPPGCVAFTLVVTLLISRGGPVGRVVEVLGDINEPGVDTRIIIRKFNIPDAHSEEAIATLLESAGFERPLRFFSSLFWGAWLAQLKVES